MTTIAHITPRRGVNDEGKGKKYALGKLIRATDADYVWLHDDDVHLPEATDEEALQVLESCGFPDLLILPLTMSAPLTITGTRRKGADRRLFVRLQQTEYALLQAITVRSAQRGHAVMCSGANMIVKRSEWLRSEKALHPEIVSGDDMFLLEDFKRRRLCVRVADVPALTAGVAPVLNYNNFLKQRMRWAGKANKYKDKDIRVCGAASAVWLAVQALNPWLSVLSTMAGWWLLRGRKEQEKPSAAVLFVLMLIYPYYAFICLTGGLMRQKKW